MDVCSWGSILISNIIPRFAKWPMRQIIRTMVNMVTLSSVLSSNSQENESSHGGEIPSIHFSLFLSKLSENDQEKDTLGCVALLHICNISKIEHNSICNCLHIQKLIHSCTSWKRHNCYYSIKINTWYRTLGNWTKSKCNLWNIFYKLVSEPSFLYFREYIWWIYVSSLQNNVGKTLML